MAFGFTLPFRQSTGSSDYFEVTVTMMHAVEQNLRSLLVTNWGERPMQFYFGCNLKQYLFEQLGSSLAPVIADRIIEQISRWMPFLRVDNLNILFEGDDGNVRVPPNGMAIRLSVAIANDPTKTLDLIQVVVP